MLVLDLHGTLGILHLGLSFRGTAIAAAVSKNVMQKVDWDFDSRVHIYVYDDPIRNNLLSEVINSRHENVKYLPGIKLPRNLVRHHPVPESQGYASSSAAVARLLHP